MAKKIVRIAKLEFMAGQSKPGPELAGLGINMPDFTRAFNDDTKDRAGEPVPVEITIYKDKSFSFLLKTAPASFKLKQAAGIKKGASNAKTDIAGKITKKDLEEIAKYKMPDLNANDINAGMKIIAGTAKNMGILIEGWDNIAEAEAAAKQASAANVAADAREVALDEAQATQEATKDQEGIEIETVKQGAEEAPEKGDD